MDIPKVFDNLSLTDVGFKRKLNSPWGFIIYYLEINFFVLKKGYNYNVKIS